MDDQRTDPPPLEKLRCADFSREVNVDPIGTAGSFAGYLLVQQKLPWPRDVKDLPDLAPLAAEAAENSWRLQAVVPQELESKVIRYRRPDGDFAGYVTDDVDGRDILICTHGRRDVCCGKRGHGLWSDLTPLPGVRSWRTSHLGGHRFAPTAVILPEGTCWAYLDPDVLHGIVTRTLEVDLALSHYRGCAGMGSPVEQAADRAALGAVGWTWLDRPRKATVIGRDDRTATVEVVGSGQAFRAIVETIRNVPVPVCGSPIEAATKHEAELRVLGFDSR